jgi:gamma-glutamylcyclotransferase
VTILYFAYGPNMNQEKIRTKVQHIRFLKRVYLKDHKFVYDGLGDTLKRKSFANIIEKPGSVVWGALYEVYDTEVCSLDEVEGYPFYEKKTVEVKDDHGECFNAVIYWRKCKSPATPSREYRKVIVQGAKDCKLPAEYILKISYMISC